MKRLGDSVVRLVSVLLCAALLAGCTGRGVTDAGTTDVGATGGEAAQAGYSDAELELVASDPSAPSTLAVRFYEDMPSVPYVGLSNYLAIVFGDEATVEVRDGTATVTSTDGGTLVADDARDTLTSSSWSRFHNYVEPMREGRPQGFIDFGTPFARIASLDYEEQAAPVVFDLAPYGIDVHVGDDDAYLPLATASDLMSDVGLNDIAYNGERACLLRTYAESPSALDPDWYGPMMSGEPRARDMADFAYAELCFAIDTLYSCSGKGCLDDDIREMGLDATLLGRDDATRRIRDLLLSQDVVDYTVGAYLLGYGIYNGHTSLSDETFAEALAQDEGLSARLSETGADVVASMREEGYLEVVQGVSDILGDEVRRQRDQIWGDGETYREQGDTAVISLDSFMDYDRAGWDAHYAGTGEVPDGRSVPDVVATLVAGLERASANPAIRYVVFDLTCNGGGSNDLCATALAIVLGEATVPVRDLASGQRYTIRYDVDSLFDGSFDTAARSSAFDFDYAVLTSRHSFSCGNLFPSVARDAGIPIIGERSGGGTDMICRLATPEGLVFTMTNAFAEMCDERGERIEDGVPVDVELVAMGEDGARDYSGLYDVGALSEVMHELYEGGQSQADAA